MKDSERDMHQVLASFSNGKLHPKRRSKELDARTDGKRKRKCCAKPRTSCHCHAHCHSALFFDPFLISSRTSVQVCVCGWLFTLSHFHHCVSFPPLSCALLSSSRMCRRMWADGFEGGGACQVGACPSRQLLLNCIILRPLMDDCYGPCSSILASPCHPAILLSFHPDVLHPDSLLSSLSRLQGLVIWQVQSPNPFSRIIEYIMWRYIVKQNLSHFS